MNTRYIFRLSIFWAIALAAVSCVRDDVDTPATETPDGKVRLTLYTNAADYTDPVTRAKADEDGIDLPVVLVFQGHGTAAGFIEAAQAEVSGTETIVTLSISDQPSTIMLLSNAPGTVFVNSGATAQFTADAIAQAMDGKTLGDVTDVLRTQLLAATRVTVAPFTAPQSRLPLAGLKEVPAIDNNTQLGTSASKLLLTRSVAKASVNVDVGLAGFTLYGAGVAKAPRNGSFFRPTGTAVQSNTTNITDYLTAASDDGVSGMSPASGNTTAATPLYIYEAAADLGTSVIIKAAYNGTDYYYKLGFIIDEVNQEIQRNKDYTFTITDAGPGYTTMQEAISAPPSNIDYRIKVTDATSHEMVSNGQYYLGVSNSGVMVYGTQTALDEAFVITTDAVAAMGITTATITATSGLQVTPATINLAEVNSGVTTVNVEMASGTTTGTVTLSLGNLTQTVIFERYASKMVNFLGLGMELSGGDYLRCEIPAGQSRFKASANGDDPQEGELTLSEPGKIYVMAEINEDASVKSGELFVVRSTDAAQNQRRMKVYVQQGVEPPFSFPASNTYIGAFWRWNQTGERLIRIQTPSGMQGEWVAWVPEGEDERSGIRWRDWIKMDTRASLDAGITRDGNEAPADMILNDDKYQVYGDRTYARGTTATGGYIEFRIGLNSTLDRASRSPRYGIIHLYYNDMQKYYTLYLRQGENEDYLMRNNDNNGSGSITNDWGGTASYPRPKAVLWPVFNLTVEDFRDYPDVSQSYVQIGVKEGVFARYPTQSGALFKWACHDVPRYGWNPRTTTVYSPWAVQSTFETWDILSSDHEVCPSGYRRPNIGSLDSFVTESNIKVTGNEVSQSLYLNPPASASGSSSDNVIHGYYADGHFDRYRIENGLGGGANQFPYGTNSTVSRGNLNIANMGTLFYNPFDNASLFIPWSGMREVESNMSIMGMGSIFWTSASVMMDQNQKYGAWGFLVMDGQVRFDDQYRYNAHSLRCIKVPTIPE